MYRLYVKNGNERKTLWDPPLMDKGYSVLKPTANWQLNQADSLSFSVLPSHKNAESVNLMTSTVYLYDDADCIFLGRVLKTVRDFWDTKTVTCEGALAWLNDAVMRPYTATTAEELLTLIGTTYNAQAGTNRQITFSVGSGSTPLEEEQKTSDNYDTCLNVLLDVVIPAYGEDAAVSLAYSPGSAPEVTLSVKTTWESSGQSIRLGKNLLDLSDTLDGSDLYTISLPLGASIDTGQTDSKGNPIHRPLTIADVNSGSDLLENANGIAAFGRIVRKVDFTDIGPEDGVKTKAQAAQELKEAAAADLEDHIGAAMTLELTALDLSLAGVNVAALRLGQMSRVVSPPHNLDATYQLRRIAPLDLENPEKSKYVFGAAAKTLIASTNAGMMQTNATASKALQTATGAADAASAAQAAIPDLSRQTDAVTISSGTYSSGRLVKSGQVVTMSIQTSGTPVTTSWATIGTVPAGFRPSGTGTAYGIGSADWDKIIRIRVSTNGNLAIRGGEAISSATITAQLSWVI